MSTQTATKHSMNNLPKGFTFRETPGHGYLRLSEPLQKMMPAYARLHEYEEDCDWAIPVFYFRSLFDAKTSEQAEETLKDYNPDIWEKMTGKTISKGESYTKDLQFFRQEHAGQLIVSGGYGDWCYDVPQGYVYVGARVMGATEAEDKPHVGGFLVKDELYQTHEPRSGYLTIITDKYVPYTRDETHYTWDSFTKATGKPRFK